MFYLIFLKTKNIIDNLSSFDMSLIKKSYLILEISINYKMLKLYRIPTHNNPGQKTKSDFLRHI